MKRCFAIFCALAALLSLCACGGKNQGDAPAVKDAAELLQTVWTALPEEQKFPVIGGDFSAPSEEGPASFSLAEPAAADAILGLPESMVRSVDDAASVLHMMNANTFTCGAFHATASGGVSALADGIRENLRERQWMCGFPDKLVIFTLGDYVISLFGGEKPVNSFRDKLAETWPAAVIVCDEPLL